MGLQPAPTEAPVVTEAPVAKSAYVEVSEMYGAMENQYADNSEMLNWVRTMRSLVLGSIHEAHLPAPERNIQKLIIQGVTDPYTLYQQAEKQQ
jgi:hypothetical protein